MLTVLIGPVLLTDAHRRQQHCWRTYVVHRLTAAIHLGCSSYFSTAAAP
jgi:hypothetical protein